MASRRNANRREQHARDRGFDLSQPPHRGDSTGGLRVPDSPGSSNASRHSIPSSAPHVSYGSASAHDDPMPPPPQPRSFAPGLAPKKPKVNEYDPKLMYALQDEYSLLQQKQDAPLRGSWTTIDPGNHERKWDKLHHEQKRARSESQSRDGSTPGASIPGGGFAPAGFSSGSNHQESRVDAYGGLDPRFENPDIDVDPEVREKFRDIGEVLRERSAPRSAFEQRNNAVLGRKAAAPIKVIIGGEVAKTFVQSEDSRGELRDRHGNYVDGFDRGLMKKHLEEDRAKLIRLRDEEMVRATNEKRAWEAMDPEEQQRTIDKKRKTGGFLGFLGAGAVADDCYEYSEIPDVYVRKVSASSIASWTARSSAGPESNVGLQDTAFDSGSEELGLSPLRTPSVRTGSTGSTIKARRQPELASATATPLSSTTESTTASAIETGPELAPLEDSYIDIATSQGDDAINVLEKARSACTRRGRVVQINLHALVKYSTSAISERVFGGIIQEIQYHPKERVALVIFVFPGEASAFVQHCTAIRENSSQDYRALQMNVEWYHGTEITAIYPAQSRILSAVISGEARRVIKVNGIDPLVKKEDLARDISFKLQKILVKVAVLTPSKRYVQQREGNMAVLEFASIKDAMEAFQLFTNRQVSDYSHLTVSWLNDSCDRAVVKKGYCQCLNCLG